MNLVKEAFAQDATTIDITALAPTATIGSISNLNQLFIWAVNVMTYLGWAGVIMGVVLALFALIYKLFAGDNEEAMKSVQGYMTKAVIIVIIGILLISAGFIVVAVSSLIPGVDLQWSVSGATVGGDLPPPIPPSGDAG